MRFSMTILIVAFALLALSVSAQPQPQTSGKPHFLDNISVGEKFYIRGIDGRLTLYVPTELELKSLTATEEEKRQYEKVQEVLKIAREQGNVQAQLENLPDDLKQLREKHGSLARYAMKMQQKMSIYTVSAIGNDYVSYREENQEVFLSVSYIARIERSVKQ